MSFSKNKMHFEEYLYDFAEDGGATGEIVLSDKDRHFELPEEALVVEPFLVVEDAVTSAGSATVSVGTSTDPDGFLTATAKANLGANVALMGDGALVYDGSTGDAPHDSLIYRPGSTADNKKVSITIATAALTAGKIRVIVPFFMPGEEA